MDFQPSERCIEFKERLSTFMDEQVYPAEAVYERQCASPATRTTSRRSWRSSRSRARGRSVEHVPPRSRVRGRLSNSDYAPLAEILGRTHIASEACNCSAPDTGNMEVLHSSPRPSRKIAGCARCSTARSARALR